MRGARAGKRWESADGDYANLGNPVSRDEVAEYPLSEHE
jgi:hypothetical protein